MIATSLTKCRSPFFSSRVFGAVFFMLLMISPAYAFNAFQPLPDSPPIPADNLQSDEKIALGKTLFFDRRLSNKSVMSCNDCHNVMAGGEDNRASSIGALGYGSERTTPTLWNVAYQTVYNWDGRYASLESQLADHLLSPTEMAMPSEQALVDALKHNAGYQTLFADAFTSNEKPNEVSMDKITKALASYIRTLRTPGSAFDQYLKGDETAISDQAKAGYEGFIETGCAACHFWVNLSGPVPGLAFQMGEGFYELFPNYVGTAYESKYSLSADIGRYRVTGDETDKRMWRVPVLRNIAITAPYFHNGSVDTLDEAIRVMADTQLRKTLSQALVDQISAFLNTLTGEFPEQKMPRLP